MKQKAILVVYGEGGHQNQMQRLLSRIPDVRGSGLKVVALTEGATKKLDSVDQIYRTNALRSKDKGFELLALFCSLFSSLRLILRIVRKYDVRVMLSTGPGLAAPVALWCRILGKKVIHIETFSRFYSASMTAKAVYRLANQFYVQNKELLSIFPKAKWSGRL